MFKLSKVFAILGLASFGFGVGGCAMLNVREMSDVPKAFSDAVENTKNTDYPQLSQIPATPRDMMTDEQWDAYEKAMTKTGRKLVSNSKSHVPTKEEASIDWANQGLRQMNNDPKAQPPSATEDPAAWAARMRALLGQKSAP